MKLLGLITLFLIMNWGFAAQALTAKFADPSDKKIADLVLSNKATVTDAAGKPTDLIRVAEALRDKTFLKVKVYVAQFYAASSQMINKSSGGAMMDSLLKNKPVALSMTFLRNVEAEKIVEAYRESLEANGIKKDEPPFKNLLDEVQKKAECKQGKTLWFVLETVPASKTSPAKEQITFYTEGKDSVTISAGQETQFLKNFLSIWFGKTTDSRLEAMKEQLLK